MIHTMPLCRDFKYVYIFLDSDKQQARKTSKKNYNGYSTGCLWSVTLGKKKCSLNPDFYASVDRFLYVSL